MIANCQCCGKSSDTRLGFCFDCVECESVLVEGLDMNDNEIEKYPGLTNSMNKLKYILKKFKVI
jgi:predicted ATP-dependent serine protease